MGKSEAFLRKSLKNFPETLTGLEWILQNGFVLLTITAYRQCRCAKEKSGKMIGNE
jgi:hypothetical protein